MWLAVLIIRLEIIYMVTIQQPAEPDYIDIPLKRKNWTSIAYLGILNTGTNHEIPIENYLHASEQKIFEGYKYEARKMSFLSGRYVAKKVLSQSLQEPDLTKIIIKSGIFNQPLLNYPTSDPPGFSISHSLSCTSCLVFPQEHPMGIDIESNFTDANEAIAPQLTDHEKLLYKSINLKEDSLHIKLWTIKEALSKVLTTGLTVPMNIYEIAEIQRDDQFYFSTFKNFAQYKAISFNWAGNICSFVLPLKTKCYLENLIAYINL